MKSSASPAWKCRVGMRFLMLGATGIVSACGGNPTVPGPAAGDAGREVLLEVLDGSTDGGMACQTFPDAAGPEVPALLTFDGGVPLDRLAYALAVVRCNYWNRCSPLAPYVIGQCIDALSHNGAWNFTTRTWRAGIMGETISFGFPNAALFQAVAAGLVKYDPDQESACLQALQAQSCHGDDLWENVPAARSEKTSRRCGRFPAKASAKRNDASGPPHDNDRLEHRDEDASGESEHDAISRTDAGLGHRTLQRDDLLAKNNIFREERSA